MVGVILLVMIVLMLRVMLGVLLMRGIGLGLHVVVLLMGLRNWSLVVMLLFIIAEVFVLHLRRRLLHHSWMLLLLKVMLMLRLVLHLMLRLIWRWHRH